MANILLIFPEEIGLNIVTKNFTTFFLESVKGHFSKCRFSVELEKSEFFLLKMGAASKYFHSAAV